MARSHSFGIQELNGGGWVALLPDTDAFSIDRRRPISQMSQCPIAKPPDQFARPEDRSARLLARRNEKMSESAHAYVRGSTVKFYEWLEDSGRAVLPEGPGVWICGDCHVGNLGPVASAEGLIDIQIRDLDQTVIGNPAHDLVRLGLSLAMAARGSDLPGITTAHMLEQMMEGYEEAFDDEGAASATPELVKQALRRAAGRSWKHLADERIEGAEPTIPLGKRFWPLAPGEGAAIREMFADDEIHHLVTSLRSRDEDAAIKVTDAAYWEKGCSSLGLMRFAVLVEIGKGKDARHCLVDVKEAVATAAPRHAEAKIPRDNGERVVEGARHMSPFLGDRMLARRLLDKAVFLREFHEQVNHRSLKRLAKRPLDPKAASSLVVGRPLTWRSTIPRSLGLLGASRAYMNALTVRRVCFDAASYRNHWLACSLSTSDRRRAMDMAGEIENGADATAAATKRGAVRAEAEHLGQDVIALGRALQDTVEARTRAKPVETILVALGVGWLVGRHIIYSGERLSRR